MALVSVAEPLESRDTYHSIKRPRTKAKTITDVPEKEITFHFTLLSNSFMVCEMSRIIEECNGDIDISNGYMI